MIVWLVLSAALTVLLIPVVAIIGPMEVELQLFSWGIHALLTWWMYPTAGATLACLVLLWIGTARSLQRQRELRMIEKDFEKLREAAIAAAKRHQPEGFREDVDVAMALEAARGFEERERRPRSEEWGAALFPFTHGFDWYTGEPEWEYEASWHGVRGLVVRWLVTRECRDKSGSQWSDSWTVRYMPHAIDPSGESTQKLERELAAMSQGMPRRDPPSQPEAEDASDEV